MSSVSGVVDISFDSDFWIDVEVPANVIRDNWAGEHFDKLRAVVDSPSVVRKEIEPYWRQFNPDSADLPGRKSQMLTAIGSHNIEWNYNLYCVHYFGRNRASEYIDHYFQRCESDASACGLLNSYNDFRKKSRRFGKLILIDLLDRQSFRDILVLDFCKGKMPEVNAKSENALSDPTEDLEMGTILDQLGADSREFKEWHSFEYDSDWYIAIKRHIRDRVERQVERNQGVAEADLVVLRFVDNRLMIHAPTISIANRARRGVNVAVDDGVADEISFDVEGDTAEQGHFDNFREKVKQISSYDDAEAELTGIAVRQSPLAYSPDIEITNDNDILPALNQLKQANFDLLADPRKVRRLKINYNERPYNVYLSQLKQDDEKNWTLRYSSSTPSKEEREAFETFVHEILGLTPTYRRNP
jgi:hypothetical protein